MCLGLAKRIAGHWYEHVSIGRERQTDPTTYVLMLTVFKGHPPTLQYWLDLAWEADFW